MDKFCKNPEGSIVTIKDIMEEISFAPTIMEEFLSSWEHVRLSWVPAEQDTPLRH